MTYANRRFGFRLAASTAALFAFFMLTACSHSESPSAATLRNSKVSELSTEKAQSENLERYADFDGLVEAISQATVAAQTSGRIIALPFDVGDTVEAGDEIVQITSTEQGSRVDAAESALAAAQARKSEAEKAFQRAQDVYARNVISRADYDRVKANRDAARAQVESAKAGLSEAREALDYTVVRAPYSGTVLERHVRLGEVVSPGTPLITGVSLANLRVAVNIPQSRMAALSTRKKAEIQLADGRKINPAQIRIPMAADPATHSFRVRLDLQDAEAGVLPGTLVKVRFAEAESSAVTVNASAVVRRGELTGVYVIDEQENIRLRYIRLASPAWAVSEGRLAITSGLDVGETVALDPVLAAVAYKSSHFVTDAGSKHE